MTQSFHETRWTLIARSHGDDPTAQLALSELCTTYYEPVLAFLRYEGRSEDQARDLAHDFFARLLAGGAIAGADPKRGRFRTYLLAALKHFAADQRARNQALKRGGDRQHLSLDHTESSSEDTAAGLQIQDASTLTPDAAFDRQWALTLLAHSLTHLESTFTAEGNPHHFTVLKPWLTLDADTATQAEAAAALGLSATAVKVAIHRLRKRFRETVKAQIAQTVHDPNSIPQELDALMAALRP